MNILVIFFETKPSRISIEIIEMLPNSDPYPYPAAVAAFSFMLSFQPVNKLAGNAMGRGKKRISEGKKVHHRSAAWRNCGNLGGWW